VKEINHNANSTREQEKEDEILLQKLVGDLETVLFMDAAAVRNSKSFEDQLKHFRLIPSHEDRKSYAKVITSPDLLTTENNESTQSEDKSDQNTYQEFAASFFKSRLEETLREKSSQASREPRKKYN